MNLSWLASFLSPSGKMDDLLPWWLPIDRDGHLNACDEDFYKKATMWTTRSGGLLRCASVSWRDEDADPLDDICNRRDDIGSILSRFGDGWRIGFDMIRLRESAEVVECGFGGNRAAQMVDEAIRDHLTEKDTYENSCFIFIHLLPAGRDRLLQWMQTDKPIDVSSDVRWFDDNSRRLLAALGVHAAGIDIMTGDDLATYLTFTGGYRTMNAAMPSAGTLSSQLKSATWYNRSRRDPKVRIGDKFMATVEVHDYGVAHPHVLAPIMEAPCELRAVAVYEGMGPETREKRLKELGNAWMLKRMTGRGLAQAVMMRDSEGAEKNKRAFSSGEEIDHFRANQDTLPICDGWLHVHTWGSSREEADANAAELTKRFGAQRVVSAQATLTDFHALASSIPGLVGKEDNIRKAGLAAHALARLLPATGCHTGHAADPIFGPMPLTIGKKRNGMPYRFTLNMPDSDLSNTFLFGKSGSGKSAGMGRLASQFLRYGGTDPEGADADSCVVIVDREESALVNCLCHGGRHFEVGGGGLGVQPLRYIHEDGERARAFDLIIEMLRWVGVTISDEPRLPEIINRGFDFLAKMPLNERTITRLHNYCSESRVVQRGLNSYRKGHGPYGKQFDCVVDDCGSGSRFVVFETFELSKQKHAALVITALWWRIEREFINGRKPAFLALDEVGQLLGVSAWRERIKETAATIRKRHATLFLATQDPRHLHGPEGEAILAQMATKMFMPDRGLRQPKNAEPYIELGVPPHLLQLVAAARPKDQVLIKRDNEEAAHLISLRMHGVAARICAASSPADRARAYDILDRRVEPGEPFLNEWLRETTEEWKARVGWGQAREAAA